MSFFNPFGSSGGGGGTLPTATDTTLGGVKIGDNITNIDGVISLNNNNIISALGYTPMVFKGTVGTIQDGGTVQSLDAASNSNKGFTYKIITDGIYQDIESHKGDLLISDGIKWILVPSGSAEVGNIIVEITKAEYDQLTDEEKEGIVYFIKDWDQLSTNIELDNMVTADSENAVKSSAIYNYVNSSVSTNTAYFRGTFNSLSELNDYAGEKTLNDYAFVKSLDTDGNTLYNRYKWDNSTWVFEYALNNSSFTANQWATINSEFTKSDKSEIFTEIKNLQDNKLDKPEWSDVAGIRMDFENKTFGRLAGAVGLSHGADFNKFPTYAEMRRCNLSDNGVVNAYYGDENYKEDGTNGQIMVEIPKFYYKVVPLKLDRIADGKGFHIRKAEYYVSQRPIDGFKVHPAFTITGEEHDYIYIGAYEGCLFDTSANTYITDDSQVMVVDEDKLSSIIGVKPMSGSSQNLTRANSEILAQNRGSIWHTDNIFIDSAVQMLLMIETGGNSQSTIGNGIVSKVDGTDNMSENTGSDSAVSYRGIENFWGNIWTLSDGINVWGDETLKGGIPYIATTSTFNDGTEIGNYESAGFTLTNNNGYIKAFGYNKTKYDWLFLPSEVGGTQSDATCGDYTSVTSSLSGFRVALLGGRWYSGSRAGSFCWYLSDGSSRHFRGIGARPTVL